MDTFNESAQEWISYQEVYHDVHSLFSEIQKITPGPLMCIALARGGWMPARLLAAVCEANQLGSRCLSLGIQYINIGTPQENAVITQGFDERALEYLTQAINDRYAVWIIDGPYLMGKTMAVALEYVQIVLKQKGITSSVYRGVLHEVIFGSSPHAPWRKSAAVPPDARGRVLTRDIKPYLEYPWEYADLKHYEKKL